MQTLIVYYDVYVTLIDFWTFWKDISSFSADSRQIWNSLITRRRNFDCNLVICASFLWQFVTLHSFIVFLSSGDI